jgi:hypothetical protein
VLPLYVPGSVEMVRSRAKRTLDRTRKPPCKMRVRAQQFAEACANRDYHWRQWQTSIALAAPARVTGAMED